MLKIEVPASEIAKINLFLGAMSTAANKVMQQSINKTLTGVRTDATNEIAKVITPTKTKIRNTISIKNMTSQDGNAFVKCTGGPLNLIHFSSSKTQKGIGVQVKRSEGRTILKHAFIATMKNGTQLVVWRKYGDDRRTWKKSFKYGKLPKYYRLPVEALSSFAIPDVMGHEPTMAEILRLGGDRLKKNMNDRLTYELNRLR